MTDINFKDWFWGKFEEWRRGKKDGPTAYARFLDIPQPIVSSWLDGKYKPKSMEHIAKLAEKYPDVYEALGVDPGSVPLAKSKVSPELIPLLQEAVSRAWKIMHANGVDPSSDEAGKIISEELAKVMSEHGITNSDKPG